MGDTQRRPVVGRAARIQTALPVVRVAAFLLLFLLNLAAGALVGGGDGSPEPYGDPGAFSPVTAIRLGLAVALVLVWPLVARSRLPDLAKAVLLAAPVGVPTASLLVTLYDRPLIALGAAVALAVVVAVMLVATSRPWTWMLAAGWAWVLAVAYGWPL